LENFGFRSIPQVRTTGQQMGLLTSRVSPHLPNPTSVHLPVVSLLNFLSSLHELPTKFSPFKRFQSQENDFMPCCGLPIPFSCLWCCAFQQFLSFEVVQQRNRNSFNLQSTSLLPFLSAKLMKQNTENYSFSFQLVKEIFKSPLPNEPLQPTKSMAKPAFFLTPTRLGKLLCYLETNNLQNSKWRDILIDVLTPTVRWFGLIVYSGLEAPHQVACQSDWVSFLVAWGKKGRTWILFPSLCDHHSSCVLVAARCRYQTAISCFTSRETKLISPTFQKQTKWYWDNTCSLQLLLSTRPPTLSFGVLRTRRRKSRRRKSYGARQDLSRDHFIVVMLRIGWLSTYQPHAN